MDHASVTMSLPAGITIAVVIVIVKVVRVILPDQTAAGIVVDTVPIDGSVAAAAVAPAPEPFAAVLADLWQRSLTAQAELLTIKVDHLRGGMLLPAVGTNENFVHIDLPSK